MFGWLDSRLDLAVWMQRSPPGLAARKRNQNPFPAGLAGVGAARVRLSLVGQEEQKRQPNNSTCMQGTWLPDAGLAAHFSQPIRPLDKADRRQL